jgi:hypothetical protein
MMCARRDFAQSRRLMIAAGDPVCMKRGRTVTLAGTGAVAGEIVETVRPPFEPP